jgi:hypothetical protein
LAKFGQDLPRSFNTTNSVNELSFPLVTHTAYSDARFDSYRVLKSGQSAEQILDRLGIHAIDQVLRAEYV